MEHKTLLVLSITALALATSAAHATASNHFSNEYIDFDLPENWSCTQGSSEWACHPNAGPLHDDALIVFAGKIRSADDTLAKYEEHLKKPIPVTNPDGTSSTSQPKEIHDTTLGGLTWVDSTHGDSEVKGYYTRYLATIKDDIGVLVTYSVQKQKYNKYSAMLENAVRSVRVHREKAATKVARNAPAPAPAAMPGVNVGAAGSPAPMPVFPKDAPLVAGRETHGSSAGTGGATLLLLLLAAGGGFIYYKKKKAAGG